MNNQGTNTTINLSKNLILAVALSSTISFADASTLSNISRTPEYKAINYPGIIESKLDINLINRNLMDINTLKKFAEDLLINSKDIDEDILQVVNDKFMDLL